MIDILSVLFFFLPLALPLVGNRRLRVLVDANLETYTAATKKIDKGIIISTIVSTVQSAARFVRKDHTTHRWVEVRPPCGYKRSSRSLLTDDRRFVYTGRGRRSKRKGW